LLDLSRSEARTLLTQAGVFKDMSRRGLPLRLLEGRTLGLLFEKPSTRTRISFEVAMYQLGGHALEMKPQDSQLGRGEPLKDTARVLSGYLDALVMRTGSDDRLREMAAAATIPVINGLSDGGHPVQVLTDLFTAEEHLGTITGRRVAWVGDGTCNMAASWIEATELFDFSLVMACPSEYRPPLALLSRPSGRVSVVENPEAAVEGADVVTTDVWVSMGMETEAAERRKAFAGYTVTSRLTARASPNHVVLHCLPAHRGEEIDEDVLEGPHSAVWQEAQNRLHLEKALLAAVLGGGLKPA
jgi:ornithine carbamoyltransferase